MGEPLMVRRVTYQNTLIVPKFPNVFFRWSHVLYETVNYYIARQEGKDLWTTVNPSLIIFQTAAALEVSWNF